MSKRLSIFAGDGQLVPTVLQAASDLGWSIQFLNLNDRSDLEEWHPQTASLSNPLAILLKLRAFGPSHICMVGGVKLSDKQRVGIMGFLKGKSKKRRSTGDTGLSRLISALEFTTGAKVIGVHEIVPDLGASRGLIAGPAISSSVQEDCEFAFSVAQKIGDLDVGQAVVCCGQRIIGVEDIAGTDALLARVTQFVQNGLTGDGRDPLILAKVKKPNQPMLVDLPSIGPQTVRAAAQANISVVCVEANNSLLIDIEQIKRMAEKLNVSVIGLGNNP